ncbi:MAG: DNA replication and repair protein RecF, partial [Sediminibacterium sp.]|nr:DNA replication and repair protein RecF [Sediminibacterium sp.]
MQLTNLQLIQFRNHISTKLDFNESIIGICGKNGCGKTNLLDAIYYTSITKSYFNRPDNLNIQFKKDGFRIIANYKTVFNHSRVDVICRENQKKEILFDGDKYNSNADHIGKFPCVFIAPEQIAIINEGSENRRKLMDTILSQINSTYLKTLMKYNKIMIQKMAVLKQFVAFGKMDIGVLEILNVQLIEHGNYIFNERKKLSESFFTLTNSYYQQLSQSNETIHIQYKSDLFNHSFKQLLQLNFYNEQHTQRCLVGIHKDDIEFYFHNQPFKQIASQGQKKSLLLALKLAEWTILKSIHNAPPFLLLDDLFEKLDDHRINNLLHLIIAEKYSQVFISDPQVER